MSGETVALIISISANIIIALGSALATIYTCRINNLENIHKFKKDISNEELEFKDLSWFQNTLKSGLSCYTWLARKRIIKYYNKIKPNK